ncbi:MAG: hypothetical protein R3C12_15450 [Planctomycetaceae bacterium]
MPRDATLQRQTAETNISLSESRWEWNRPDRDRRRLSGPHVDTLCQHGCFDLTIDARGDLHVDQHHTVEDIGICLEGDSPGLGR